MRKMFIFSLAFLALSATGCTGPAAGNHPQPPPPPQPANCSPLSLGQGASLGGFVPFPSDSLWNQDISSAPVDANSSAIITFIGAGVGLHADFGAGQYLGSTIGIPYLIVGGQQGPVTINFTAYGSESDPGPMPIPVTAPIEGYPNPGTGHRHVLVLNNSNCFLYELSSSRVSGNSWNAGSAAVWDLLKNEQRPYTWTSADAADCRFSPASSATMKRLPAKSITRFASLCSKAVPRLFLPPRIGPRIPAMPWRLPWGCACDWYDVSPYSATNQVILNALKKFGMIMADNGSN